MTKQISNVGGDSEDWNLASSYSAVAFDEHLCTLCEQDVLHSVVEKLV